jgi:adenylylsulfate kinase
LKLSKRHIAKSISWRFIGTIDTFVFGWIITGDFKEGLNLSGITTITKLIWYYLHERLWFKSFVAESNKRHLFKTISWRVIGTIDTVFFGWIVTGNPLTGLKIGGYESITKMILYFGHEKLWYRINYGLDLRNKRKHLKKHHERQHGHKVYLLWFTGLSGSGKSTLSNLVEVALHNKGLSTYILDGDNIRKGINKDLNFAPEDRTENIRRIAEISNLMLDAGVLTLAAFVSPYLKDREEVKQIVGADNFIEIYVNTSLEECERRDVKGLYKKARAGEIKNMTGISAPYEVPTNPDFEIITDGQSIEDSVKEVLTFLNNKLK